MAHDYCQIRFQKCWQLSEPLLVIQINLKVFGNQDSPSKWHKAYLLVDIRQNSVGVTISSKKPAKTTANTALINTLRKQVGQGMIKEIIEENNGNLWIPISARGQIWYLNLEKKRPPQLSLLNEDKVQFIRYGQKGTFTKKKSFEGEFLDSNLPIFSDITQKIVEAYIKEELSIKESSQLDSEEKDNSEDENDDSGVSKEQKQLKNRLKRKLKTLKKSFEKQNNSLPLENEIKELNKKAHYLQTYGYLIKGHDFELRIEKNTYDNAEDIIIPLEPEISVGKNIENTFLQLKKAKKSILQGKIHLDKINSEISNLTLDIEALNQNSVEIDKLMEITQKYRLPTIQISRSKDTTSTTIPFKTYLSATEYKILVGKGPKENDELTKSAKSNDYWLHVSGMTGSHVVIPVNKSIKDQLPEQLLKEAAILALHFSKSRKNFSGEVYVTKKQYVKKQKGMAPGLWKIEKSETIYITYSQKELENITSNLVN